MKGDARKAAIAAYKDRTIATGVYALRFAGVDRVWVGGAKDLSGIENRQRFTMRTGGHPRRDLFLVHPPEFGAANWKGNPPF